MSHTQSNREAGISTPLGDDVLLLHSMTMTEELGRLFSIDLELLSTTENITFEDLLGQRVTIRLDISDDEQRFFNGHVSRFSQSGLQGSFSVYQATVRPWFWFLTRTADCRIFQQKTVPDIIKEIFRDHGYTDFEEKLSGSYRTWEYCVQYRETDFNFVSRLMEQEGIYYYFTHEENKHTLVLADAYSSHEPFPEYESIPYYPPSDNITRDEEYISNWYISKQVQPGIYALNEYDFIRPKANLEVNHPIAREHVASDFEVYDYPGEYVDAGDGDAYVRTRIEEIHVQYEQAQGQSDARGIMSGGLFELTNYSPREDQNREYLVTAVTHNIQSDDYESGSGGGGPVYSNNFSVIESQSSFRPARTTPKPMVQGPQTAIVVGPAGEEIHTDEHARVKLQFHWDRYGLSDENSSCWIRVSQVHAGKGFGGIDTPRIDEEVIVEFLEGDPDRPIITGRVYNGDNTPPNGLPGAKMVSGLKSNSTPGGGGDNSIMPDDTKGKEGLTTHAQYNMDTTVENDQTVTVASGNRTVSVQSGTQAETIKGDASVTVQAGARTVSVTGGDFSATSTDAAVNLHGVGAGVSITGDSAGVTITGTGGPGVKITGTPDFLASGSASAKITSPDVDIGNGTIKIHGSSISIEAQAEIKLSVGGSTITLTPGSLATSAPAITTTAGASHDIKGAIVKHNC